MVQISRHFVDLTGGADGLALEILRQLVVGDAVAHARAVPLCRACVRDRLLLDHPLDPGQPASDWKCRRCATTRSRRLPPASQCSAPRCSGFLVSAAMTALAAGLYMQFYMAIDPEAAFGLSQAIQLQLPALIGGLGTAWGPIIGGAIMIFLSEVTNWGVDQDWHRGARYPCLRPDAAGRRPVRAQGRRRHPASQHREGECGDERASRSRSTGSRAISAAWSRCATCRFGARRRGDGTDRPERRRQIDAVRNHQRQSARPPRGASPISARTAPRRRATLRRRAGMCRTFQKVRLFESMTVARTSASRPRNACRRGATCRRKWPQSWLSCGSRRRRSAGRPS